MYFKKTDDAAPVKTPQSAPEAATGGYEAQPPENTPEDRDLLLVDSDGTVLEALRDRLYQLGYSIYVAKSGRAAIHKIALGNFRAVISAEKLSDMDISELANTLKKSGGELGKRLVLFLPDEADEARLGAAAKTGISYMQKSMPQQQVKEILEKLSGG